MTRDLIAEQQLRDLHRFWPESRWSLQRCSDGYVMICRWPLPRWSRAETVSDAIADAFLQAITARSLVPSLRLVHGRDEGVVA